MGLRQEFVEGHKSSLSTEATYEKVKENIQKEGCKIFAEFDFEQSGKAVNVKIPFNRLILFGNPEVGIHLLTQDPSVAINMPMKILVYENDNHEVFVKTIDVEGLMDHYKNLDPKRVKTIAERLHKVVENSLK